MQRLPGGIGWCLSNYGWRGVASDFLFLRLQPKAFSDYFVHARMSVNDSEVAEPAPTQMVPGSAFLPIAYPLLYPFCNEAGWVEGRL